MTPSWDKFAFDMLKGHMDRDAESAVGNSSLNFNSGSGLQTHPCVSFTECRVRHGDCALREQDTGQNPGFVNIQVSAGSVNAADGPGHVCQAHAHWCGGLLLTMVVASPPPAANLGQCT